VSYHILQCYRPNALTHKDLILLSAAEPALGFARPKGRLVRFVVCFCDMLLIFQQTALAVSAVVDSGDNVFNLPVSSFLPVAVRMGNSPCLLY